MELLVLVSVTRAPIKNLLDDWMAGPQAAIPATAGPRAARAESSSATATGTATAAATAEGTAAASAAAGAAAGAAGSRAAVPR